MKHLPDESFGGLGREPGKFVYPYSVAVDVVQDRVFVTDMNNGRIQVFTRSGVLRDGSVWSKWHAPIPPCAAVSPTDWFPPEAEQQALAAPPGLTDEEKANFQLIHGVTIRCGTPLIVGVGRQLLEFSWKGDFDSDGDVDQADFAVWQGCMSATCPDTLSDDCRYFDFNEDQCVDINDFDIFWENWTGALSCAELP